MTILIAKTFFLKKPRCPKLGKLYLISDTTYILCSVSDSFEVLKKSKCSGQLSSVFSAKKTYPETFQISQQYRKSISLILKPQKAVVNIIRKSTNSKK
jgi:hypothetical protein